MVMEFTSFKRGILMLESGVTGRVMGLESRFVLTEALTLESSRVDLSMALAVIISGMEIDIQGSISVMKCMVLVCINLPTVTYTRDHGMRVESKVMAFILSETVRTNVANGVATILRLHFPLQPMQSFEQFRLLEKAQKVRFTFLIWMNK